MDDEGPEWLRLEPGETVRVEGDEAAGGITIPGVGVNYRDGLTALEQFADHMNGQDLVELQVEVLHIRAAKQGMVVVTTDSRERYEKRLAPIRREVPVNELQPEDVDERLLHDLDCYGEGPMQPYVMYDSERTRRAVDARLDWRES